MVVALLHTTEYAVELSRHKDMLSVVVYSLILFVWCNQFRVRVVIVYACPFACLFACPFTANFTFCPYCFRLVPCNMLVATKSPQKRRKKQSWLSICLPRRSAVIISHKCCVQMRLLFLHLTAAFTLF